ncbi:MAG: DUF1176 domain-containing protein [Limnothrix sp. RL_2_0]|nr:DUF1176 domain-containing protein [Limnothrix sp. RL_2_0]
MKTALLTGLVLSLSLLMSSCGQSEESTPTSITAPPQPTTEKSAELPEGAADKSDSNLANPDIVVPAAPQSPPVANKNVTKSAPIPVPAANIPTASSRNVPPVSGFNNGNGGQAIAKTFQSLDISGTIVPYLIANKQKISACQDTLFDPSFVNTASNTYRVGENTYLVHFACGSSAYQTLQEYYLYEKTTDKPVITPLPITYFYTDLQGNLVEETERTMAGFSNFDPPTQTINIFTKSRGLGDCGSLGFYKLVGSELKIQRFLVKDECDGNYIDPIDYPQVYP